LIQANNNFLMLFDLTKPRNPRDRLRYQNNNTGRQIVLEDLYLYNSPLAFMPDGKTIVCASTQNDDPAVHFIDLKPGKVIRQIDNDQQFMSLDVSPDGKYLALGGHQRLEIWDAATGNEVRAIQVADKEGNLYFRGVTFSPTGTMVAALTAGNTVQLWEAATG